MKKLIKVLMLGCLTLFVASCGSKKQAVTETVREERVKVSEVKPQTITREYTVSATLEGYETMNITPSLTGTIESIKVEVGDKVKKGDMLVLMDQNQYKTTKLQMENLETEMKRMEALRESGNISQQAYDQTKLGYDQTKEAYNFLAANTFVKAQFSGTISAKNYEDGELYGGASPILKLTQINMLKAYINIPESYFPKVKAGMKLDITSEIYPERTFAATVEVVHPTIDAATHTFQVKVKINNSEELLRPGMYIRATLPMGETTAMVVPYQAVLKLVGSNERYVFINNNGVAKRVSVKLGQRYDDKIEIISNGIKSGDQLVVVGQARLVDGAKLIIVE